MPAAGPLNGREAARVEKALAHDRAFRRRETIHLNETLGVPPGRALGKLLAAIDAAPVRKSKPGREVKSPFDLAGRLADFVAGFLPSTPRREPEHGAPKRARVVSIGAARGRQRPSE